MKRINWLGVLVGAAAVVTSACGVSGTLSRDEAREAAQTRLDSVALSIQTWEYGHEGRVSCKPYLEALKSERPRQYTMIDALMAHGLLKLEDRTTNEGPACFSVATGMALDSSSWRKNMIGYANEKMIAIAALKPKVAEVVGVSQAPNSVTAMAEIKVETERSWLGKALGTELLKPEVASWNFRKFDDGWRIMPDLVAAAKARLDRARAHSLNVM